MRLASQPVAADAIDPIDRVAAQAFRMVAISSYPPRSAQRSQKPPRALERQTAIG
jgi:hypothetical protein